MGSVIDVLSSNNKNHRLIANDLLNLFRIIFPESLGASKHYPWINQFMPEEGGLILKVFSDKTEISTK